MYVLRPLDAIGLANVTPRRRWDYTSYMRRPLVLALLLATVLVFTAVAPAGRLAAGVVILDPDASPQGRAMEEQLARAGYATLVVTGDPIAAASALRRRSGVRADDIALVGYGSGASGVLATIVEPYVLEVAQPPVFRSAVPSPRTARVVTVTGTGRCRRTPQVLPVRRTEVARTPECIAVRRRC